MTTAELTVDSPVLELLRARRASGSSPGRRSPEDTARLGLLVQGGGMRGVISAAMLCALDDLGYKNAIDVIFGCSSGAMNAAYFLAAETWYPLSIYYDDLASPDFVDFLRPLRNRPIMDLDYAFGEVVRRRKPLAVDAALSSGIEIRIAISGVDPPRPLMVSDFESSEDFLGALQASCWLPIATPGTASFRGIRAVDGGVLMPSMTAAAEQDGCTHLLSLRTSPQARHNPRRRLGRRYVRARLDRLAPGLGAAYDDAQTRQMTEPTHSSLLELTPLPGGQVERHELNGLSLLSAARSAYGVMFTALEGYPIQSLADGRVQVIPRLTPVVSPHCAEVKM